MSRLYILLMCSFLVLSHSLFSAHFENFVDVTIKVEDASYTIKIKSFKFNGEVIALDPSDNFKPRKLLLKRLSPGRYVIAWTAEKSSPRSAHEPPKEYERILVLESGDSTVRISVKGDTISMY